MNARILFVALIGGCKIERFSVWAYDSSINVAIASDHRLVESGPYRFVRHPSYTGALMLFLGLGVAMGNWLSVVIISVPIFLAFWWRMRIEEAALLEALGETYRSYMNRTKRLIPMIY